MFLASNSFSLVLTPSLIQSSTESTKEVFSKLTKLTVTKEAISLELRMIIALCPLMLIFMRITIVAGKDTGNIPIPPLGCGNLDGEDGSMISSLERFQQSLILFSG